MATKDSVTKATIKLALLIVCCCLLVGLGYITVWVSLHMQQTPLIRIIIGASGPIWALLSIYFIIFRTNFLKLWQGLRHQHRKNSIDFELQFSDEYMALKEKYPLAIRRHEQHCRHHHIDIDTMINDALEVPEEEWAQREEFRRQAKAEKENPTAINTAGALGNAGARNADGSKAEESQPKDDNSKVESDNKAANQDVVKQSETLKDRRQDIIEQAWENRELLRNSKVQTAIREIINKLDKGQLRIAEKVDGKWQVNEWIKKAVILYFPICQMETVECGPFEFHDKIPLKRNYAEQKVRVVPHAIARQGAYLAPGVVMMPSYVNIGAYVDSGTMVDTWATVGSCAQIGKNVHLSGGVGIGGVLEPVQAAPVIIEDNCFIGSRCIIVEGAVVEEEAVIGANTVITASTHIIDVTQPEPVTYKGRVPARSIVIPGSYTRHYPAGDYQVSCALIIGLRSESTDKKTSLNAALRDYGVSV